MDNLDLISSLQEMNRKLQEDNRKLQEENTKLKKENEHLVISLEKYEPKQNKIGIDKEEKCIWGEGETGWGKY